MATDATAEIDWNRLDKQKFFGVGAVVFTGLTTCLFPLSVIKTRQMALENVPSGIKGAYVTARTVLHHDGVQGLYKGFGTVISGAIPARIVYLSTLEGMKSATSAVLQQYKLSDTVNAGMASFVAGGCASLISQSVIVPVDVVAQRLMIMGGGQQSHLQQQQHKRQDSQQSARKHSATQPHQAGRQGPTSSLPGSAAGGILQSSSGSSSSSTVVHSAAAQRQRSASGLHLGRQIIAQEGVVGLYRGFWASAATFVPNSAIWWGCYGTYQRLFWHQIDTWRGTHQRTEGEILGVQACAGIITGLTSAALTNPLDVVKTRLQTRQVAPGQDRLSFSGVAGQLIRSEGVRGFYRGVAPRMISSAVWGTAMVTTYEFLKRLCALPPEDSHHLP